MHLESTFAKARHAKHVRRQLLTRRWRRRALRPSELVLAEVEVHGPP